jgi:hypothetical protein
MTRAARFRQADIPQDIMVAAALAWDDLRRAEGGPAQRDAIARAIMAERARCAKVAASYFAMSDSALDQALEDDQIDLIEAMQCGDQIAAAIRKGAP